jgi:hypothetical protein
MITKLNDLMCRAGLTAQGCWDNMNDYDHKAIVKFGNLIVQECLLALEPNLYESAISYKVDQAFYLKCERIIKKHFEI